MVIRLQGLDTMYASSGIYRSVYPIILYVPVYTDCVKSHLCFNVKTSYCVTRYIGIQTQI